MIFLYFISELVVFILGTSDYTGFASSTSGLFKIAGSAVFLQLAFILDFVITLLMQKTRTIWGASLFHSAADLHWFIAFGFSRTPEEFLIRD